MSDFIEQLKCRTENYFAGNTVPNAEEVITYVHEVTDALNKGVIASVEKNADGDWQTNIWVKHAILLLFRFGKLIEMSNDDFVFFDKDTIPLRDLRIEDGVRVVPGGSSIRTGAFIAPGVICMPPMYINIGAYIDAGTMIDSHALVGTCARIGKNVHISAGTQIGGVLEPAGASPVIIEDGVMVGGNCGIYEGTLIRENAVIGTGVILNASTKVFDVINESVICGRNSAGPVIPYGAVVVPGSRKLSGEFAESNGLHVATPVIVKYRDAKTNARTALEEALR